MKLKKIQAFSLLILSACSGASLEGPQVSKPFFETLCQARTTCEPQLNGELNSCISLLEKSNAANSSTLKTTQKGLEKCLEAIKKAPCQDLYGLKALPECDF
ncbi:MAG: hypothetical protein KDK66_04335 [Deltaproteobacteria bacterium]|nr:hypothetical protein [Deltaproteobacteria bacterium]